MAKKKILVVDDEAALVDMIKMRLEASDYEVVTASDGQEGFEKIEAEKPDLVILDILMPKMSGYDLLRKLRQEKGAIQYTPVLVVSARGRMKSLFEEIGISDFLAKPFDGLELMDRVERILSKQEQKKAAKRKALLIARDREIRELLEAFLGAQIFSVFTAENGSQGIERAVKEQPDIVLCQSILEDMNATEVFRVMRGMSAMARIPFIIFSSQEAAFVVEKASPGQELIEYSRPEDLIKKLGQYLNEYGEANA
ncbi:MAG: response regulator [Candidatus Omnitrophica bacterium]|nr:response regulator [Candidatus Omnitrophota bacterium]